MRCKKIEYGKFTGKRREEYVMNLLPFLLRLSIHTRDSHLVFVCDRKLRNIKSRFPWFIHFNSQRMSGFYAMGLN